MSEAAERPTGEPEKAKRRVWLLLPLIAFLALAALFFIRLDAGDPSRIPSALINKPVPDFSLPPLEGVSSDGLSTAMLGQGVHVVNVWASWCGPCRLEHPVLMRLAEDKRFQLSGLNYKDQPENARRFLGTLGNPFDRVGADRSGGTAIDWGVYGVPETFIVKDGLIVHKVVGPLSEDSLRADFMPALQRALAQ